MGYILILCVDEWRCVWRIHGGRLIEGDGKHYLLGLVLHVSGCGGMYCCGTNFCMCVWRIYGGRLIEGDGKHYAMAHWHQGDKVVWWLIRRAGTVVEIGCVMALQAGCSVVWWLIERSDGTMEKVLWEIACCERWWCCDTSWEIDHKERCRCGFRRCSQGNALDCMYLHKFSLFSMRVGVEEFAW